MDCRRFRKHHLAYLDDTLSGDMMAAAQRHILACNACAAHDTLVRRSLMIARSMPIMEPSADFQQRLRARLAECREEVARDDAVSSTRTAAREQQLAQRQSERQSIGRWPLRAPRAMAVVAAGAVLGTMVWRGLSTATPPVIAMQPVIASQPAMVQPPTIISPALISAMSTGNPMWPAAMLIEEAPTQFVNTDFRLVSEAR